MMREQGDRSGLLMRSMLGVDYALFKRMEVVEYCR